MSYVQKKTRVFRDAGDVELPRKRSEGRMKTFPSATDARAWCDISEDRRQYILELILRGGGQCLGLGKYIPIEAIIDILLASKNAEIEKLMKQIEELQNRVEKLQDEQKKKPEGGKVGDDVESITSSARSTDQSTQPDHDDDDMAKRLAEAEARARQAEKDRLAAEEARRKAEEAAAAAAAEAKQNADAEEELKSMTEDIDMLRLERDRLQMRLNELENMEEEYNILMCRLKCLENVKKERDMYKEKYEELVGLECECNMLRALADKAKCLENERDALQRQVCELQCCVADQEDEIKKLTAHSDRLSQGREEQQEKIREALACMRNEIEKKDQRIASSEQKLAKVQERLRSSIQSISCETSCLRARIEELEKELETSNSLLMEKEKQMDFLYNHIKEKESIIHSCSCHSRTPSRQTVRNEYDAISLMKKKLEAAKAENEKLQIIAAKMSAMMGYDHVEDILKQSKCAVLRVTEDLGKRFTFEMGNL